MRHHVGLVVISALALGCFADIPLSLSAQLRGGNSAGRRPGEERVIAGVVLRWCPAGQFRMGSPPTEFQRRADENQVSVTLSRGFWIGKYEVTQAQWSRIDGGLPRAMNFGSGDDYPMYWVSYLDAERFCQRLSERAWKAGDLDRN